MKLHSEKNNQPKGNKMSKTIGLHAKHWYNDEWVIVEMQENGGETNINTVEGQPNIINSNGHAIIHQANGVKLLYDFETQNFKGI